jgi:uncharacterized phiE125 gp8 family phage protein
MADYTYTAAASLPVSLAEVKDHLYVTGSQDDALLTDLIRSATAALENRCNRCFVNQTRKLTMHGWTDKRYVHGDRIYFPRSPVANSSGVSITYVAASNGTTTTWATSDYTVHFRERPSYIGLAYNASWPDVRNIDNSVTVTYTAGHGTDQADVPHNVKLAIKMLVGHWYRNREATIEGNVNELPLGVESLLEAEHIETYG